MNTNVFVLVLRLDPDVCKAMELLRVTVMCCSCCLCGFACLFWFSDTLTELGTSYILGSTYHLMMQKCAYLVCLFVLLNSGRDQDERVIIPQVDRKIYVNVLCLCPLLEQKNRGVQTILLEMM